MLAIVLFLSLYMYLLNICVWGWWRCVYSQLEATKPLNLRLIIFHTVEPSWLSITQPFVAALCDLTQFNSAVEHTWANCRKSPHTYRYEYVVITGNICVYGQREDCMYVIIDVCVVCVYVYVHTHVSLCVDVHYACMHMSIQTYVYILMYVYELIARCISIHAPIDLCRYVFTCIYGCIVLCRCTPWTLIRSLEDLLGCCSGFWSWVPVIETLQKQQCPIGFQ